MIRSIPAFQDNYIWVIEGEGPSSPPAVIVVDPGDPEPVLRDLAQRNLQLAAILITHHHGDHVGGITTLVAQAPTLYPSRPLPVYGPHGEDIPGVNARLRDGDVVEIEALDCRFSVMEVPGHTLGHIAYFGFCSDSMPVLFCGDTLFAAGCGRLFEGTPEQMYASLQRLASLPPETAVYCTHEYTLSNLIFAAHTFPQDPAIAARLEQVRQLRSNHCTSLPTSIEAELSTNPFLKCGNAQDFARLRRMKDDFRG
jgi:hydroxyacylglutathione hydrolase